MKDRSYLIYVVFIALMAILIFGCKTQAPLINEVPIQYKERIVERLVPVTLPDDSSSIKALFECDSLNNCDYRHKNLPGVYLSLKRAPLGYIAPHE